MGDLTVKASISNYSGTLTLSSALASQSNYTFRIFSEDATIYRVMYLTFEAVKDLSIVNVDGIRLQNNYFDVAVANHPNNTICVVMKLWMNRNFYFYFFVGSKVLSFNKVTKELSLITTAGTEKFTVPSLFIGKKIVLWFTENSGVNVIKATLSNYASTLTKNANTFNRKKSKFRLETEDSMFLKLMFSSNFYDFDSEQYHRVLLRSLCRVSPFLGYAILI